MLRKDVKSQLFSTGMLISLLLGLVLLVEPQYQYFLYFARWDNKADYINFSSRPSRSADILSLRR